MMPDNSRNALVISGFSTPLGEMVMVCDAEGICVASEYADHQERLYRLLARRLGHFELTCGSMPLNSMDAVAAYFAGDLSAINHIKVRLNGTSFQNRAWAALRQIPPGETVTYTEQAARIGNPKAARAVGGANHNNPYNLIVPCHRVVGANGALTGYAGGMERKRWLLEHERKHADAQLPCREPTRAPSARPPSKLAVHPG